MTAPSLLPVATHVHHLSTFFTVHHCHSPPHVSRPLAALQATFLSSLFQNRAAKLTAAPLSSTSSPYPPSCLPLLLPPPSGLPMEAVRPSLAAHLLPSYPCLPNCHPTLLPVPFPPSAMPRQLLEKATTTAQLLLFSPYPSITTSPPHRRLEPVARLPDREAIHAATSTLPSAGPSYPPMATPLLSVEIHCHRPPPSSPTSLLSSYPCLTPWLPPPKPTAIHC